MHLFKFFDGHENLWKRDEREVERWKRDDLGMPDWLQKLLG